MSYRNPARTTTRRTRRAILAALVVGIAAFIGVLVFQSRAVSALLPVSPVDLLDGDHDRAHGEAGGDVPDGLTVFNDEIPAVANLEPDLLSAVRKAATDAADDGVEFVVNSGWRSPAYQERLLEDAVSEYGSESEAARWVATADTSAHVSGDAIDIGRSDAMAWLSEHGAEYGLCPIYHNEPWHYELRPEAIDHDCPPMYADPTQDPRMKQ